MQCAVRMVKVLMGKGAVAERKCSFGTSLPILGPIIQPTEQGYKCWLSVERRAKYLLMIEQALGSRKLQAGCAKKLAGRLSWSAQFLFKRIGRSMLRPIFQRAYSGWVYHRSLTSIPRVGVGVLIDRATELNKSLEVALNWWKRVLEEEVVEEHHWKAPDTKPVYMFVDARGVPPRFRISVYLASVPINDVIRIINITRITSNWNIN